MNQFFQGGKGREIDLTKLKKESKERLERFNSKNHD